MLNKSERIKNLEEHIVKLHEVRSSTENEDTKEWFLKILKLIEEFTFCLKESSLSDKESYSAQKGLEAVIENKLQKMTAQIIESLDSEGDVETDDVDSIENWRKIREGLIDLKVKIETTVYVQKIRDIFLPEKNELMKEFAERVLSIDEEISLDAISEKEEGDPSGHDYIDWDDSCVMKNGCSIEEAALCEKLMGMEFSIFDEYLRKAPT